MSTLDLIQIPILIAAAFAGYRCGKYTIARIQQQRGPCKHKRLKRAFSPIGGGRLECIYCADCGEEMT